MGVARIALLVVVIAVLSAYCYNDATCSPFLTETALVLASPFVQLGFRTGLIQRFAFVSYDDSGLKYIPSVTSRDYFNKFRNYELPEKSVVAVTFPKSGTHLLLQLLLQIQSNGEMDFENIHHQHSHIEIERHNNLPAECQGQPIKTLDNIHTADTEYKVFATHLSVLHCPRRSKSSKTKFVVMMRDPLDTLLSTYDMVSNMLGSHLSPKKKVYADLFFTSEHDPGSWAPFYRQWWLERSRSDVLFLFYEDVIKNKTQAILQVANFLEIELGEDAVKRIEHLSSVAYMKENRAKFDPPACSSLGLRSRGMPMINKGKAGRGKKAVPQAVKDHIRKTYYIVFRDTDFPLERYATSFAT